MELQMSCCSPEGETILCVSDVLALLERLGSDRTKLKESVLIGCSEQNQVQFCLDVGKNSAFIRNLLAWFPLAGSCDVLDRFWYCRRAGPGSSGGSLRGDVCGPEERLLPPEELRSSSAGEGAEQVLNVSSGAAAASNTCGRAGSGAAALASNQQILSLHGSADQPKPGRKPESQRQLHHPLPSGRPGHAHT